MVEWSRVGWSRSRHWARGRSAAQAAVHHLLSQAHSTARPFALRLPFLFIAPTQVQNVMRRTSSLVAALILLPSLLGLPSRASETPPLYPPVDHLHVEDGRIVDTQGRKVLLRGVNVNQLGDYFQGNPEVPATMPFSRRDVERIAALGSNVVRLLVHWSALEPEPGVYDDEYIDQIHQAVTWCRSAGLSVVLDMHQDAWGKYIASDPDGTCIRPLFGPNIGWDGAPEWATYTLGMARCAFLGIRELSPAVMAAWHNFWGDRDAIQQHLIDTWAVLAAEFRDDSTVIGYDLINEPNVGFRYFVTLMQNRPDFYAALTEAIRDAEAGGLTKIVFYEPFALWSAIPLEPAFRWTEDTQIIFAPHIYLGALGPGLPLPDDGRRLLSFSFWEARRESRRLGTTFWVGEWGWFRGPSDYTRHFARLEDEYQVGSAFWQWKQACGDPHGVSWPLGGVPAESGNLVVVRCGDPTFPEGVEIGLHEDNALLLSRPYPRRFPGDAEFESDVDGRRLSMWGEVDLPAAPIEVWVPGEAAPVESWDEESINVSQRTPVEGGWIYELLPATESWSFEITGQDGARPAWVLGPDPETPGVNPR